MLKIVTIIGARPQFVKAAVLSRVISSNNDVEEILVHTGQHYDHNMSDVFFEEMEIPKPGYNLDVNGMGHGAMTGQMLEKIEAVLEKEQPEWVLVYGDTNSTIAGALAAKKMHIKVAHVEAGLRSFNMEMPEEVNRILTDRISDILFVPTETAIRNLKNEGYDNIDAQIVHSGDVMQDASHFYAKISESKAKLPIEKRQGDFVLCTLHRAENTDNPERLVGIVNALNELHKEIRVLVPIHPRTRKLLEANNLELNVDLVDPVGYFDMIELLKNCKIVLTDSGGLQKEAYFFQKHCVTMRDETEWVELVENGYNVLAGADTNLILSSAQEMMSKTSDFSNQLYGDSMAGEKILSALQNFKK
ncbi:MAG: UDP-N-acetylglucosamine 2-epimerase (non-hydrolyzing) [Fluviicola sp. XM-24bin1]|nr:MAG: UDP-N-acetylglucosamine 2-epimerase (non-hydrolyzing) [Fluviicola sp. XM-24bin1]